MDEDAVDEELRAELLARCEEDQRVRKAAVTKSGHFREIPDDIKEMLRVDEANTAWLAELTGRVGWPGRTLVGEDGAHAAWLLAQHADRQQQPAFLELLRAAVAAGEASARDLAYLEDRVRVHAGQPQRYGTQFTRDDQGRRPQPIEAPEHLDERRAAVGLGPFAEYEARMRRHG
ncbi:MAG TPA: DUF6624 domain-containing protein [Streptosporangiaceae bacterium]